MDSVFRTLWLAAQSRNILHYSLIHLQFHRASDAKLRVEVLTREALFGWLEFIDETGEKVFCLQMQIMSFVT